jgi:hypothetical protein
MGPSRVPGSGRSSADDAGAELRGAALFKLIWDSVADVLGTTATATLLQRAARRAVPRSPELGELAILRTDAGFTYTLPRALVGKVEHRPVPLRELVRELRPLLVELTGQVVVRRLEQIPGLQDRGILSTT